MAALDLSTLGIRATPRRLEHGAEGHIDAVYDIDTSVLTEAMDRLRVAVESIEAAWLALPVGAREHLDGATLTLHAHPDRPRFSEEWDAERGAFVVRYGETWSRVAVEAFAAMTPAQRETVRAEVVAAAGAGVSGEVAILATKRADDSVTFRWETVPEFATGGPVPDDGSTVQLCHDSGGTRAIIVGPDGTRRP